MPRRGAAVKSKTPREIASGREARSSKMTAALMTARRAQPLKGSVRAPGDKSISHRALILGALARGETQVEGLLEGEDVKRSAGAMRAFGAEVERLGEGAWRVVGRGVFAEPADVIDCGNAGTGVRLIMGTMATSPITARVRPVAVWLSRAFPQNSLLHVGN